MTTVNPIGESLSDCIKTWILTDQIQVSNSELGLHACNSYFRHDALLEDGAVFVGQMGLLVDPAFSLRQSLEGLSSLSQKQVELDPGS